MIKFLTHSQIDKTKWDSCINNSPNKIIYAYSWYLDVVNPEWNALVEDDYQQVFPLTWRKKSGITYLYQPPFTQYLGLFSKTDCDSNNVVSFIESIPQNYKLIEITIGFVKNLKIKNTAIVEKQTYLLGLNVSYEQLSSGYSTNTKRNIKKALNAGVIIKEENRLKELIKMFRENRGKKVNSLNKADYHTLENIRKSVSQNAKAQVYCAYTKENKFCAGALFLIADGRSIFIFSATNSEAKELSAMHLLIDRYIFKHANQALILDFEGSEDVNLARFYKSFGSVKKHYLFVHQNKLPALLKHGVKLIKQFKKK